MKLSDVFRYTGNEKAVVAFVVSGLFTLLAQYNVNQNMTLHDALTALGVAVLSHLAVYFKSNSAVK